MIINHDSDAWMPFADHRACAFHRENPTGHWAGCTCSSTVGLRPATPEEKAENRRRRLGQERSSLQARLAAIHAEIGDRGPE